jgi:hypothetical protein
MGCRQRVLRRHRERQLLTGLVTALTIYAASLGPYSSWVAGYQTTTQTNVTEVSQSGDTVTVSITAQQTDGSTKSYTGDYTVDNGQSTSAHITQN